MSDIISKHLKVKVRKQNHYQNILLKNVKHDLISPINAIFGYCELIIDTLHDEKNISLKEDINSIHESSTQLLHDINAIFNIESITNDDIRNIFLKQKFQFSLRVPLSTVIGLTEIIRDDLHSLPIKDRLEVDESIEKILQSGKWLLKLLNNLKKYAGLNVSEIINKYKTENYLEESSLPAFDFSIKAITSSNTGNILIVDDEPSNLELVEQILLKLHHTPIKASNALEAQDILNNQSIRIDIILLDLIMPGINGLELLQQLKANEKTYHIPIIILSAMDEFETIVDCIKLGADDFLIKPVNRVLLDARLNNALGKKYFHDKEIKYQEKIKQEQNKSEMLLLNVLPRSIAERLKNGETLIADDIENATVLFADLSGFTTLSTSMSAKDLVLLLNNVFSIFDELLTTHSLEKIKTIGDNYMLAGGIPNALDNHAVSVAEMALDMIEAIPRINMEYQYSIQIRIGINSGPVSAGVIGKKKFIYDLWGDTVNVASRMESYGENNHIHVAASTYDLLKGMYQFEKREALNISGKGMMQTYFLKSCKI